MAFRADEARLWRLILDLTEKTGDDLIRSLRVPLFLELNQKDAQPRKGTAWEMASCLWSFRPSSRRFALPPVACNKPLFLFGGPSGAHTLNLLPVAREAGRRGLLGGIVTGSRGTENHLREFEPVVTERQFLSLAGMKSLPTIVRQVRRGLAKLINLLSACDPGYAARIGRQYGWFFKHMVESARVRIAFHRLVSAWQPSSLISTCDLWPYESQFYWQAKRSGIPNAVIQHGELGGVVSWPTCANTFLVWGEVFRDKLLRLGAPSDQLQICGMPAGDDLFQRFSRNEPRAINRDAPVCLVLSHTQDRWEEPGLFADFGHYLAQVVRSSPHVQWKIKLHPNEEDIYYREGAIGDLSRVEILPRTTTLQEAVDRADVVCTIRSTAGLQAMMMQRPLIVIDLVTNVDCSVWWPLHGGGLAARNAEAFGMYLNRLVNDVQFAESVVRSQEDFLSKAFANRGMAAKSVVDFLAEQIGTNNSSACQVRVRACSG